MVEGVKIIINVHTGKVYDFFSVYRSISSQAYVEEDVDRSC